jgi:hypothetical protein
VPWTGKKMKLPRFSLCRAHQDAEAREQFRAIIPDRTELGENRIIPEPFLFESGDSLLQIAENCRNTYGSDSGASKRGTPIAT